MAQELASLLINARSEGVAQSDRDLARLERRAESATRDVDRFGNSATRAGRSARSLGDNARASAGGIGRLTAGIAALGIGVAGIGSLFRNASSANLEFTRRLGEVATINDAVAASNAELREQTLELTRIFGGTATEQVRAFYTAYSAGAADSEEAGRRVSAANMLAIGGVAGLGDSVAVLSSITNAYSGDGLEAARITDLLFLAVRNGQTDVNQLSAGLSNVLGVASAFGVEFGVVTSAVAGLTAAGVPTAQATTQIRALIVALNRATPEFEAYAESLGITATAPQELAMFITQLNGVLANTASQTERNAILTRFFGAEVEALGGAALLSGGGFGVFNRTLRDNARALGDIGRVTQDAFAQVNATDAQRVSVAYGELNTSLLQLGESINTIFIPAIQTLAQQSLFVSDNINVFAGLALGGLASVAIPRVLRGLTAVNENLRITRFAMGYSILTTDNLARSTANLSAQSVIAARRGLFALGGSLASLALILPVVTGEIGFLTSALQFLPVALGGIVATRFLGSFNAFNGAVRRSNNGIRQWGAQLVSGQRNLRGFIAGNTQATRSMRFLGTAAFALVGAGGPLTLIAGAAGAGAVALALFSDNSTQATRAIESFSASVDDNLTAIQNFNMALQTLNRTQSEETVRSAQNAARALLLQSRAAFTAAEAEYALIIARQNAIRLALRDPRNFGQGQQGDLRAALLSPEELQQIDRNVATLGRQYARAVERTRDLNQGISEIGDGGGDGIATLTGQTLEFGESVRTLGDAFDDALVGGIMSASDAFGDFISGSTRSFRDFGDQLISNFRNTISELVSTAASNQILISLGLGGLTPEGTVGRNAFGTFGDILSGAFGRRQGDFALTDAGRQAIDDDTISSIANLGDASADTANALASSASSFTSTANSLTTFASALTGGAGGSFVGSLLGGAGAGVAGSGILAGTATGAALASVAAVAAPIAALVGIVAGGAAIARRLFGSRITSRRFEGQFDETGFLSGQENITGRRGIISGLLSGGRNFAYSNPFSEEENELLRLVFQPVLTGITAQVNELGGIIGEVDFNPIVGSFAELIGETGGYAEALAASVPNIAGFRLETETFAQTLQRLARELPDFTLSLGLITSAFRGDLSSARTSGFISGFDNISDAGTQVGGFFNNFFSEQEQRDRLLASVQRQFAEILPSVALPASITGFRALVEDAFARGNDELAGSLIRISEAFADVRERTDELNSALSDTGAVFSTLAEERLFATRPENESLFASREALELFRRIATTNDTQVGLQTDTRNAMVKGNTNAQRQNARLEPRQEI